ncbi:hypothetical protein D3C76_907590 [compost metagenome]
MAEHHALGETGSTSGIENAQQGIAMAPRILHRGARGNQCFVVEHAGRGVAVTGVDDRTQCLRCLDDLAGQGNEVVIDNQHAGLRVIQRIDDLGHAPADIDRIEHRVGPGHCLVVLDVALGVEREYGHSIAAGDAQGLQGAGEAGDAVAELCVGNAAVFGFDGNGVRAALKVTVQTLGDVHRKLQILVVLGQRCRYWLSVIRRIGSLAA